jgi:hypothetical protein
LLLYLSTSECAKLYAHAAAGSRAMTLMNARRNPANAPNLPGNEHRYVDQCIDTARIVAGEGSVSP